MSYFPLQSWIGTQGLVAVRSGWISGKSLPTLEAGGGGFGVVLRQEECSLHLTNRSDSR